MGQHNFLDGSNFTALKITSISRYDKNHKTEGTGFFVRSLVPYSSAKEIVYLLTSKSLLNETIGNITLDFREQDWLETNPDVTKSYSVSFDCIGHQFTSNPNSEVDLACIELSDYVKRKFINGVSPHFLVDNDSIDVDSPVELDLGNKVCFTNRYTSSKSVLISYPKVCIGTIVSPSKGTVRFMVDNETPNFMVGTPVFVRNKGEYGVPSHFYGVITKSFSGKTPQQDLTTVGIKSVRRLLDLALDRTKRSTTIAPTLGSPPAQQTSQDIEDFFGT